MANVVWEEQANGPEGAYCRVSNGRQARSTPLMRMSAGELVTRSPRDSNQQTRARRVPSL